MALLAGSVSALALSASASAEDFNIPSGDLRAALNAYAAQARVALVYPVDELKNARTRGVVGNLSPEDALGRVLMGTGFTAHPTAYGSVAVVHDDKIPVPGASSERVDQVMPLRVAAAAAAGVETIVVTSSKIKGDIQTVPIAITALSQEQLTSRQIAGGPDLVKEVPNLTFSKTNFTGYNIQIRGIGTQAISVSTDPAVAVSFNDIPFLRNHFFEQEFFDVSQVEVLRGPQGTLYGRNATAGVVNVVSAKPTDQFEAQASADIGNYTNRRYEGMVNIPIWGDKLDLRAAGEWTKRDGYSFNEQTNHPTDGRDLWSGRVSLLMHPFQSLTATAIWEHFSEDDDRTRSTKQLCTKDVAPAVVDGPTGPQIPDARENGNFGAIWLEQGCAPASLYSAAAFETPNAASDPFIAGLQLLSGYMTPGTDPYAGLTQSPNLRVISSLLDPKYTAKNDTLEFNLDYALTPTLTVSSQTGFNRDSLYSTEDFNRYNTAAGIFRDPGGNTLIGQDGQYCDPQLGCSSRLVAQDVSDETAQQFYQEVRVASSFGGKFNFLAGANYLSYHTLENFYIFGNAISLLAETFNGNFGGAAPPPDAAHVPFDGANANSCGPAPADPSTLASTFLGLGCSYIDPNPLNSIDGNGHNYFRSQNPYRVGSWATFGEAYYDLTDDLKLTGGLRYTDDKKHFDVIPSWALIAEKGYPITNVIQQEWREFTGRVNLTWSPKLDFTDQSMFYGSYARGYKGGGANPPGVIPVLSNNGLHVDSPSNLTHPSTFLPEFNDAFELGTKNTLFDGAMTLNGDVFYYKYRNYQLSQIIDRTAVNFNVNATVKGAELESTWSPLPGLKLGLTGGYENATVNHGQSQIDIMDRTAGNSDWLVVKPFVTETSNCILRKDVVNEILSEGASGSIAYACFDAYTQGLDPITENTYVADPNPVKYPGYIGFDPAAAPNLGEGFAKDISGNQLPNAPHFTLSASSEFTVPVGEDWAATWHADFYWQSQSFARVFNDRPYDKLRGYANVNLAFTLTSTDGWQGMLYVKNVFDTTSITGAFLNSDDAGLTTNIFITDPRLFGVRVTKNW